MAKKDQKPRTRTEIREHYKTTAPEQRADESDIQYYKRLAKVADQRLVRLERLASEEGFEGVLGYSYKSALRDIRTLTGNRDATRFNVKPKQTKGGEPNKALLHARINAAKRFIEAPTSMKSTIKKVYDERAESLNEKYGTDFDWEDLSRFWEAYSSIKATLKDIDSDLILKAIAKMQREADPEQIRKGISQNVRVREDAVVDEIIKTIKEEQLSLKDFGI